ncbi:MAG: Eco29kI family restriction endonuclease [Limisphaerales bacterium]
MPERFDIDDFTKKLRSLVASLPEKEVLAGFRPARLKTLREEIEATITLLQNLSRQVDPVVHPKFVFDPTDPKVIGELIARTLLLQAVAPLSSVTKFYGSGVYAIYYRGDFPSYRPISGTENPIYVGKADPATLHAQTVQQQGNGLSTRLLDHNRSITAATNLKLTDFDCRYLVVKSAWQETAEDYLIDLFKPIWNNEMGICYGFGKHGDAAKTRANRRSPWDTLHPGRKWALTSDNVPNERSVERILADIADHFAKYPPRGTAK